MTRTSELRDLSNEELEHRLVHVIGEELRVGPGQDDVAVGQDHVVLVAGDAHHVADDLERQLGRDVRHEVARPGGHQVVDDRGGHTLYILFELGDQAGAERPGHDPAQPGVPRVVHVDHGTEVLIELDGQVDQARRALPGAEHVGIPADGDRMAASAG